MSDYVSLGNAIQTFLRKYKLEDELRIQRILTNWEAFVGRPIAKATEKLWYENGTLHIKMSSPAWRNELVMARLRLQRSLNEKIGKALIRDIVIS
jgi:predicted nucleic acid-binding Zn ribbon protein